MALKELESLSLLARKHYPSLVKMAILHRVGECAVMQESVAIAVSSPHRKESLDAIEFLIDALKSTVPIWKKEIYADGSQSWKKNSECQGCSK